ncbi:MAG: metallophosphoesterase [Gammaproteobacteria bacterium]|nr:MAG: metallophosphoesterase [Gammaproteobacteria bacterium]
MNIVSQTFAQISDPHLSSLEGVHARDLLNKRVFGYLSWRRKRRFEHRAEVLQALQRDLRHFSLDQLLVTGDLTHIGLPQEFEQGRAWLQQLGEPGQVALVPGNHDTCVRADWDKTFGLWRDYMTSDGGPIDGAGHASVFPSLRVRKNIAFIGVSTGCPKPPLMATGTVGTSQLNRLPALLEEAATKKLFRVVFLHHSPLPGKEKWRKRLTDAAAVQAVLSEHGVELILHGHGHRAHYNELSTRDGVAPVVAVPSASALGLHGADVARYNCYSVDRDDSGWRLEIMPRCYQPTTGEFIQGENKMVLLKR